jgi:hypothetical protein
MAEQQEEKKRKKYLLPIVLLFAVCLIGGGFAYTAWTQNSGNDPASEYIVLTQTGTGAYTFAPSTTHVYYDTQNTGTNDPYTTTTKYDLSDGKFTDVITNYTVIHLGKQIIINASSKNVTADPADYIVCTIESTDFKKNDVWRLFLKIDNGTDTIYKILGADNTWHAFTGSQGAANQTFNIRNPADNEYTPVKIDVYYGYLTPGEPGNLPTTAPWAFPLNEVSSSSILKFKVSNEGQNPGMVLSQTEVTVVKDDLAGVAITAKLSDSGTITVKSSSVASIATATVVGTTITITGDNVGRTVVTFTVTIGGVEYTADCIVNVVASA